MRFAALAAVVAAAVLCAGCGGAKEAAPPAFQGVVLDPARAAPQFALHDQAGARVSLAGERGHFFVVTFLYTQCPDVCPAIAGTLNQVLDTKVGQKSGLRVLAVSVDPKRDTPAAVRSFVRQHGLGPKFRYLTGTPAELARTWKGFQVAVVDGPKGSIGHSSFEILVDPQGRERLIYDATATSSAMVHDIAELQGTA